MTYAGHLPDGSGIQRHSAGSIFPVVIVAYGDGTARWVDAPRKAASSKMQRDRVQDAAELWFTVRDQVSPWSASKLAAGAYYADYLAEFRPQPTEHQS